MTIKFNLLPKKDAERVRANRQRSIGLVVVAAVLGGLAFLYMGQLARANMAENRLEEAQAELSELNAEVAALSEYQQLKDERRAANEVIVAALGAEISLADLIDSVGAGTPPNSWYQSWQLALHPQPQKPLGSEPLTLGRLTLVGTNTQQTAPGVRSLVDTLGTVEGFANVFVASLTEVEPDRFANSNGNEVDFHVELDLTGERLTGRYLNGLPEALTVAADLDGTDTETDQ